MKKKLFLALLTTLLLLLAASTALAADYSDYTCTSCGNPCEGWYPLSDNGLNYHVPACYSCGIVLLDKREHCTPKDGTATCKSAPRCNVCSLTMSVEYGPDPDAHSMVESWSFTNEKQHFRVCQNGCSKTEYADHTGGTATCSQRAVCDACNSEYGDLSDTNHGEFSDWEPYTATQHYRYCIECSENYEYADHTGGTASCTQMPECEVCHKPYGDLSDTNHGAFTEWTPIGDTQHYRYCTDCGMNEYADHTGGTATCTQRAVCEACHAPYGEFSDTNHGEFSDWMGVNNAQHLRYCTICAMNEEYADHTGGTATCMEFAVCEVCHAPYGELSTTNHGEFTEWMPYSDDDTQHYRRCKDCGWNREYGNHTGGTATCTERAVCDACNSQYGELSDANHGEFTDWMPYDDTQHYRRCIDCWENREYADHTGGTATRAYGPICEVCGSEYGEKLSTHNGPFGEWERITVIQHWRMCETCEDYEREDHTGGTATCAYGPICEVCGGEYGEKLSTHNGPFGEWEKITIDQHWRMCETCKEYEYADHTGGTATCAATAVCDVCHEHYGFRSSTHTGNLSYEYLSVNHHYTTCDVCNRTYAEKHTGGTATCESGPICELCETAYGESLGGHDWSEWESGGDGTHTRICSRNGFHVEYGLCTWGEWAPLDGRYHERRCGICHAQDLGEHTGGTATFSQPATCEDCGAGYGSPDNSGLTGHPNPVIESKPGTCYDEGYWRIICDEPGCSAPFTEFIFPANGQHIYNDWQPLGDGTHISTCTFCGTELIVPCTPFTADGFTACPICGEYDGGVLPVLLAREDDALPCGTLVVRGGEIPVDGVLFAFTVAGSYGGYVVEPQHSVTVSIPMALDGFRIVGMDGAEISFTLTDGLLTVETGEAGLFLLLPAA